MLAVGFTCALDIANASAPHEGDFWTPRQPPAADEEGPANLPKALRVPGVRHWHYMLRGVPAPYADAQAPPNLSPAEIKDGAALYGRHCASCHGPNGYGVRDDSQSLLPSPALLAFLVQKPIAIDEYLLWSISEGGAAFESEMPAFKDRLSREEIWKIVAFMRAGFPSP